MLEKKVTVIIPVHGTCPYLKFTILSIHAQTFKDFRVILVNDRASSDVNNFMLSLCKKDKIFSLISSTGIGISNALNTGLRNTRSKYVARIDADDLMNEDRLRKQVSFLDSHPRIHLIGTQMNFIDADGRRIGRTFYPSTDRFIKRILNFQNCLGHPSVMIRTETIKSFNGYTSFYDGAEDYELWTRIIQDNQVANLKERLTSYRISDFQMTKSLGAKAQILGEIIRLKLLASDLISTFPEYSKDDIPVSLASYRFKLNMLKQLLIERKFGKKVLFNSQVTYLVHAANQTNLRSKIRLVGIGLTMFLASPITTLTLFSYHYFSLLFGFFTAKIFASRSRK